jgi:hypothetical protein
VSEQRRFHPSELDVELGPESAELLATARDLESYAASGLAAPSVGFEDRVMAAVAAEPMPRRAGRGFIGAVRDAWAIAFGPDRPIALRAQAFAMLFALAVAVGSVSSVAVVGAARLLGDQGPVPPTVASPSPSPSPSPSISPSPSPSISPVPTPSPSVSPDETETAEPSGTDDGGGSGNSGPGGGGDDSGGSSGSGRSGSTDDSSGSGGSGDSSGSGTEHD